MWIIKNSIIITIYDGLYVNVVTDDSRRYHDGSTRVDNTTCAESGTMITDFYSKIVTHAIKKKILIASTYLDIRYNFFVISTYILCVVHVGCINSRVVETNNWHFPRIFLFLNILEWFFDFLFFEYHLKRKPIGLFTVTCTVTKLMKFRNFSLHTFSSEIIIGRLEYGHNVSLVVFGSV